jgi:hypothetical protein
MPKLLIQLLHLAPAPPAPLALTPAQRWAALRPISYGAGDYRGLYTIVLGLLAAVGTIIVTVLICRWIVRRRQVQLEFREQAERAGLGQEETNLLTYAATLGQLRAPANIVVTEAVFQRCIHLLMHCQRVMAMSAEDKTKILSVINSVQLKLGFEGNSSLVGSRQIPEGAVITLTGAGVPGPVQATIISARGWEIKAQANAESQELPAGAQLRARYCRAGSVWEFETKLVFANGRDLTLAHAQNIRFVNRRRFRRVSIDRPAALACFPFVVCKPHEPPVFHPARLIELGSTGLVFEADDMPSPAEKSRVLVLFEPRPGRSINAIGIVLRSEKITSHKAQLVVELTHLSESDVSDLVSETNLADQPGIEAKPPAAAAAAQPAWRE